MLKYIEPANKNWVLKECNIRISYIRIKIWLLGLKNPLYDFLRERNIDSCKQVLDRLKSVAKAQQFLRENPFAMIQICRCMDICKIADVLGGREAPSNYEPFRYYQNELIVLDIQTITAKLQDIYEATASSGSIIRQAFIADSIIEGINLYGNIGKDMQLLGRFEFVTSPYSIRFAQRDIITNSNKNIADVELTENSARVEYINKESKNEINEQNNRKRRTQSEFGIIEPNSSTMNGVEVNFQMENEQFNPFTKEVSDLCDKEIELKQKSTNVKKI